MTATGLLNHIEMHCANPDVTMPFYKDLLGYFGWQVLAEWPGGMGIGDGHTSLWFFATPDEHKSRGFNRDGTGLGHIGIHLSGRDAVETFYREYMQPRGIKPEFDTPRAREEFSPDYYQVMFLDPEGLAIEVFHASGTPATS